MSQSKSARMVSRKFVGRRVLYFWGIKNSDKDSPRNLRNWSHPSSYQYLSKTFDSYRNSSEQTYHHLDDGPNLPDGDLPLQIEWKMLGVMLSAESSLIESFTEGNKAELGEFCAFHTDEGGTLNSSVMGVFTFRDAILGTSTNKTIKWGCKQASQCPNALRYTGYGFFQG